MFCLSHDCSGYNISSSLITGFQGQVSRERIYEICAFHKSVPFLSSFIHVFIQFVQIVVLLAKQVCSCWSLLFCQKEKCQLLIIERSFTIFLTGSYAPILYSFLQLTLAFTLILHVVTSDKAKSQ